MRIITGTARGRKLAAPSGEDCRPTSDRVKESLFSIVQFDIEGRRVLDLYAGSGQLGIEALSRGAAAVTFVDQSRACAAVIRENLAHTQLEANAAIRNQEALSFLASNPGRFDLILCDPPFHTDLLRKTIRRIAEFDILSEGGIMVGEAGADFAVPAMQEPYRAGREYGYGSRKLLLIHRDMGETT
jgi:16S rRNA (guanine(966)-N(2))-methyltransferase RsmD